MSNLSTVYYSMHQQQQQPMMMQQPMMVQQPMHGQRGSAPGDSNGAAMLVAGLAGGMVLGSLFD